MKNEFIDLTGKRFGSLVVESVGPRVLYLRSGRRLHRWWNVVCDCGWRGRVRGIALRAGRTKRCLGCARKLAAERGRASSVRLPSGRLLVEVAEAAGVSANTTLIRWRRGWSEEDLSLPVDGNRGRKAKRVAA